jgi:pyruvate/2-oxoglutarate dehydrogenase complex dihydrolipoamide dehydrogenase (E3) component
MAQAFRRLGACVTVLEAANCLAKDDPELAAIVVARLRREGVELREKTRVARIERTSGGIAAVLEEGGRVEGSHLLVATGRAPTTDGLDLAKAGVAHDKRGITVDDSLRTSNRNVWAIGDCNGRYAFTHMAGHEASLFIRGALFRAPAKLDPGIVAWATYTDPELAQVGLNERDARAKHGDGIKVLRWAFAENDRAQTERETDGLVKVVTDGRGRVLGAGIAGPQAGELIQSWCLALSGRLKISTLASFVPPYPTLGETAKRAAGSYYTEALFGSRTRFLVRFLARLPVW